MDEETKTPELPLAPSLDFRRDEEFASLYANNVRLEPSVWDLKLIFGQLDQSSTPAFVEQHTAMSIPWVQAKLLAYYIEVNLAVYEADNGYIRVAPSVTPAPFDPASVSDSPQLVLVWEFLATLHKRFFPEYYATKPQADEPKSSQG